MAGRIIAWLVYLGFVAGLLFVGWKEPLRYRFMSRAQIEELEHRGHTPVPVSTPRPNTWMTTRDRPTKLDNGVQ